MWGWFTGWVETSPVSQRLFLTTSATAAAIPCRAPSGTLACCWLAVPPAAKVEALCRPVLAGTWRSVAGCCVVSAVSAAPRLRLETLVRYALLTAGLFRLGGILGGSRSGLITHLALYAQNNSKTKTDPTTGANILDYRKKKIVNCINGIRWGRQNCLTNVMRDTKYETREVFSFIKHNGKKKVWPKGSLWPH